MRLSEMKARRCDAKGCGGFGDSRGARTHKGYDLACKPNTPVQSPIRGRVSKLGWPYLGQPAIRYVEITSEDYRFRLFYVSPSVDVGEFVEEGDVIGKSQELESMRDGGTQHIHFEIKDSRGEYIDPTPTIIALRDALR